LKEDDIAIPCGLIAKSLFTDKYEIYKGSKAITNVSDREIIPINSDNIAWKSDVDFKFKN